MRYTVSGLVTVRASGDTLDEALAAFWARYPHAGNPDAWENEVEDGTIYGVCECCEQAITDPDDLRSDGEGVDLCGTCCAAIIAQERARG